MHRPFPRFLSTLALCVLALSALPVRAEVPNYAESYTRNCCKCYVKTDPNKKICIKMSNPAYGPCHTDVKAVHFTNVSAADEKKFASQLDQISCETTALTDDQCQRNGPSVSATCPADPIDIETWFQSAFTKEDDTPKAPVKMETPELGVKIPGLQFNKPYEQGDYVFIPFLADYINAAYRYAVAIAVIAAIVMVVYGGFRYLIGSAAGDVKKGKTIIMDAIAGMILTLAAFLLLYMVNPATTFMNAIKITKIDYLAEQDSGDTDGEIEPEAYSFPNVYCPKSGGVLVLPMIIDSLKNKVTYRWGGKGKPPPPNYKEAARYQQFASFCPNGTLCLDCSGFVNYVFACAGMTNKIGSSRNMQNAEVITSIDSKLNTVNGKPLNPGDLLGYTKDESKKKLSGHVILYIGKGQVAQSRGGDGVTGGRRKGANPVIGPMPSDNGTYKHIIRLTQ